VAGRRAVTAEGARAPHERRRGRAIVGTVAQPTVLLVEDDPDSREMMRQVLVHFGARVVEATNGREALERLATANPHLALIDLRMPVMDGYELARRIRRDPRWRHLQMIAVTGFSAETFQRTWMTGFDAHLVKPITPEMLARILGPLLPPSSPPGSSS
jgi:CheY-like chemotaxis protein